MKSTRLAAIVGLLVLAQTAAAVDSGKAAYIGGTLAVKEKTEAPVDLKGADDLVFKPKGQQVRIRWTGIDEIEYGQKVGHRVKTAILLTPLALFSKNRRHYVTLSWKDSGGHDQAAVFEFDKNDIRPALASLRARSGKNVAYQDDQARKQMGGAEAQK